jgi:hypothetical protein
MQDTAELIQNALVLIDKVSDENAARVSVLLRSALDSNEWTEKGLVEWRDKALENSRHAEAARATARIAIAHLNTVLNTCRTHDQQTSADTQARDWLLSIGFQQ